MKYIQIMNNTKDITQAFTCPNFRQFVIDNFCNGKTPILQSHVKNVERLELPAITKCCHYYEENKFTETFSGPLIQSLDGINYFTGLKELIINQNWGIKIDLSENKNLIVLECGSCELKELDLSSLTKLEKLNCRSNEITQLNISHLSGLKYLNCNYNQDLTDVDVSQNNQLLVLEVNDCNLQLLDVTQNVLLEELICSFNEGISIDLTNNILLKRLECKGAELTELNISNNNLLEVIDCSENHIKILDTANKPNLRLLHCGANELEILNVTNSPKLEELSCGVNNLKELDISQNPVLRYLSCGYNCLTSLDLTHNPVLKELYCQENQLTTVDFTHNPLLEELWMYCNKGITSVDISKNPVLFRIRVAECSLTELDLSNNPVLNICSCDKNKLTQIPDISNNPYLQQAKSIETSYVFTYDNNLIPQPPHTIKGVGKFEYSHDNYELKTTFNNTSWFITLHVDTKQEVKKLASTVRVIWEEFPQLIEESIAFIMSEHPQEKDFLYQDGSTLEIEEDKTFRIGFDMGESPGGEEVIYVGFDRNRKMIKEVIFEYY